jgi:hypothetical protein
MVTLKPMTLGFKVKPKVAILIPIAAIGCRLFWLGSPIAWAKHWPEVLALVIVAEILAALIDAICKILKALWKVCRKRRFRGMTKVVIAEIFLFAVWGVYFWHYSYVREPHFNLDVAAPWGVSSIPDYPGVDASFPVSDVFFPALELSNNYVPSKTRDWKVTVTFLSGDTVIGEPTFFSSTAASVRCTPENFIYGELKHSGLAEFGIGNGNRVRGCGDFIFRAVSADELKVPGTMFTISFRDSRGAVTETTVKFTTRRRRLPNS